MTALTGKRITARVPEKVQETLQHAADMMGATLNQFVVQAALEKAERLIQAESTISLTRRESMQLLDMLENPKPRSRKFLEAMARYRRMKNSEDPSSAQGS